MILADTPSLGLLLGLPAGLLITLAALAWSAWWWRRGDHFDGRFLVGSGLAVAVVALILTAICMWPWKWEYHAWKPVTGKAERISKRLVPAGDKGMQERFVVVIDGRRYGVDDTRASLLRVGDTVSLSCKREYQWGSSDHGYGCRWNRGPA